MAAVAAMLDERQRWSLKGTFLQSHPMSQNRDQSTQALVRKSMETKYKMAAVAAMLDDQRVAMLDERQRWPLKGTFLQSHPMSQNRDQSTQALVRKSMETKSKMAAILDEWRS
jgi:predicted Zn-dependent protease